MTTQAPVRTHRAVPARTRRAWWVAAVVLAAAALFTLYWRQSLSVGLSSDGASNVLQAWDMLHGNLLLHNWRVSDVSFYTTELPQYVLIEAVLGLGPWVVHVGAAMTYTLLVLLAAWLAKGRARGQAELARGDDPPRPPRVGMARALLAGGIMLAPQLSATQILLLSPDHTGTAVPVLVTWLVIDRSSPERRTVRWLVPLVVCALLTWAMIADSIVLITCIVPLVLVCAVRACPGLIRGRPRGPAPRWYELSLAGAAAVAGGLGSVAPRVINALGGYHQAPVKTLTALTIDQLRHQAWVTFQAFLELFGANVLDARSGTEVFFAALHFVGVIMVLCAMGLAFARFFRSSELLIPVFAVAILLNLVAYMISPHAQDILGARETAAVLPLGAVLAGRVLGEPVLKAAKGWLVPALALVALGYLGALAFGAAQPTAASVNQPLAAWLVAHGLTDGLAGYWQANSTTLDSSGRLLVSGVTLTPAGYLKPYQWETDDADYNPSLHDANFVVTDGPAPLPHAAWAASRTFGPPQRIYSYDGYTILVWDTNILTRLH